MVRTQIQLTERQLKALRDRSAATGRSIADLIRQGVDQLLEKSAELAPEVRIERALAIAGKFSSGQSDVSAQHDKHLAEAFGN